MSGDNAEVQTNACVARTFTGPDGSQPVDTNGSFYGATYYGGVYGYGSIFDLSVGLGPFVETLPTSGNVGATVRILGTKLTGATSVTFNGIGAAFIVNSDTLITATVPVGATIGFVKVTTPAGTLTSAKEFRVT